MVWCYKRFAPMGQGNVCYKGAYKNTCHIDANHLKGLQVLNMSAKGSRYAAINC